MKKIILLVLAILLLVSNVGFAEKIIEKQVINDLVKQIELINGDKIKTPVKKELSISVNGKNVIFPDTKPFVDSNSRILVPLRFVAEEFGVEVVWNAKEQRVDLIHKKEKKNIQFYINQDKFVVNGIQHKMDTKAIIKDGRTMIPIRFFAESFGLEILFDGSQNLGILNNLKEVISNDIRYSGNDFPKKACELYPNKTGFVYIVKNEDKPKLTSLEIVSYCGKEKELIIPDKINGYAVTSIGNNTFNNNGLTSVIIPNSVKSIGERAFAFNNLTKIKLPESLNSIRNDAFSGNQIEEVFIPNSIKTIYTSSFFENPIKEIIIDNSPEKILFYHKSFPTKESNFYTQYNNGNEIYFTPKFLR